MRAITRTVLGTLVVVASFAWLELRASAPPSVSPGGQQVQPGTVTSDLGTFVSPGGVRLKMLLDRSNVGPEVSMGEMTFPPNSDSGEHTHGAIEMFYVLSGELEHVVNGRSEILKPGMIGYVRPPDKVRHKTGAAGAKTLVMWVPGEEAQRISSRWKKE